MFLGTFSKGCFAAQVHCCLQGLFYRAASVQSALVSSAAGVSPLQGFEELHDVPSCPFLQPVQIPPLSSTPLSTPINLECPNYLLAVPTKLLWTWYQSLKDVAINLSPLNPSFQRVFFLPHHTHTQARPPYGCSESMVDHVKGLDRVKTYNIHCYTLLTLPVTSSEKLFRDALGLMSTRTL